MKSVTVVWMWVALSTATYALHQITGRVTTVIDGNTVEVVDQQGESYKVVLAGIDCPELGQEYGEEAKLHLEKLVLTKNIIVEIQGKDRSGNYLGIVFVDDLDPRMDLLNHGLAWAAEKGSMPGLKDLEGRARQRSTGLWEQENPTPPWVFRRQQSMMTVKGS
jgi:endonuclease YncB( thermonuclease family)